jgi:hypothetical protein
VSAAVVVQAPQVERARQLAAEPRRTGSLDLSFFERRAVTGLISENGEEMEEYVAERAAGYASGDGGVRRRSLARAAAVQEALVQELTALLSAVIARRDDRAAMLLDKALNSATNRYRVLLEQLRTESVPTRRVTVMAKGSVAISAEAQG